MNGVLPSRRQFLQISSSAAIYPCLIGETQSQDTLARVGTRVATGKQGVVATVHPIASEAAIAAFDRGGNAIDAAIAASLMLSVVDGFNSGIGGGCLAMLRLADGSITAIDGRETAPLAARPEMFFHQGKPDPQLSQVGPLACGVPGLLSVLNRLAREHGRADWHDALEGAADVAEEGFVIDNNYASRLRSVAAVLLKFPESARVLLDSNGAPRGVGDHLRQPDLARTLRAIASDGTDWFYRGEFAERVEVCMRFGRRFAQRERLRRIPFSPARADPLDLPKPHSVRISPAQFRRHTRGSNAGHAQRL